MTLSVAFVESRLRFLRAQQLITGEMSSYEATGDWGFCYAPRPLYSAISFDALSCLDPDSRAFESHITDRFPVAKRSRISAAVWSLRWRLRTYLAWEEEADGSWRAAGRHSCSDADAATTASASVALLNGPPKRATTAQNRRLAVLQRWLQSGLQDRVSRAHTLCYLSLTGADTGRLTEVVLADCRAGEGNPAHWYAVARAWHRAALPNLREVAELLVPRLLIALRPTAALDDFARALTICALLDLGYAGSALAGSFHASEDVTCPPVVCPAATAALSLSNALRAQMRIPGTRLD